MALKTVCMSLLVYNLNDTEILISHIIIIYTWGAPNSCHELVQKKTIWPGNLACQTPLAQTQTSKQSLFIGEGLIITVTIETHLL